MRILIIATAPFHLERGKSLRIYNHVRASLMLGHEVHVVTYPNGKDIEMPGLTIERVASWFPLKNPEYPGVTFRKIILNFFILLRSFSILRRMKYDALHCHDADGAAIGLILRFFFKTPVVYDMHGSLVELLKNLHSFHSRLLLYPFSKVEKLLYRNSDAIIVNWPHLEELIRDARQRDEADAEPVMVVGDRPADGLLAGIHANGSPTSRWLKDLIERHQIKQYIVYTGNFAQYQRADLLLESMARLLHDGTDVHLIAAGGGFEAVQPLVRTLGIEDRVIFTGNLTPLEVGQLLSHAAVAVSPRMTEDYPPMKVIGYLAAGVPIVATDWSCHNSILRNGETALLCPPTPEGMAEAIRTILNSEEMRERLRKNSYEAYLKNYNAASLPQEIEDAYRQAVASAV